MRPIREGASQYPKIVTMRLKTPTRKMVCPAMTEAPCASPAPTRWATSAWPAILSPKGPERMNNKVMKPRDAAASESAPNWPSQ